MRFSIYRFNPETGQKPRMQAYELPDEEIQKALLAIKDFPKP